MAWCLLFYGCQRLRLRSVEVGFVYSCSFVGCACGFVIVGFLVGYRL